MRKKLKYLKVFVKHPGHPVEEVTILDELTILQNIVGGYIEIVGLNTGNCIICNEEGKLQDLPVNVFLPWGEPLVGSIVIVGRADPDLTSCTMSREELLATYPWLAVDEDRPMPFYTPEDPDYD